MSLQLELPEGFYDAINASLQEVYRDAIEQARRDSAVTREFLSIPEVAKELGISRNTLTDNFISKGLPLYRIEGKQWIKRKELYDFINQHRV